MKSRERNLLIVVLALISGAAGTLCYMKTHQHLGKPGIRATAIPGLIRMQIQLVTNAPGYVFRNLEVGTNVTDVLPKDTSVAQGTYRNFEGEIQTTVVMMGTDRTSIHRPQFCLTGDGWDIDNARSEMTTVHLEMPRPLDLPVMKLVTMKTVESNGAKSKRSGVYVYWFVAEDAVTADDWSRVKWMGQHLLRTGELQRWAYITYFAPCAPGQEDNAFRRVQRLMNATVPEFQLAWPASTETAGVAR